jgi:hypothetical protein
MEGFDPGLAMPCRARAGGLCPEPVPVSSLPGAHPYRTEHIAHLASTAALIGSTHFWRACEVHPGGYEGAYGTGDTEAEAIADLERRTAWRRK